jgi:hypothetical protein
MQSYAAPKSQESQLWEFRDSHLGVSGQKAIWMWASCKGIKYIIRGKVVASLKSGPWWVLWVQVCPWFVCRFVWVIKCLSFFLVPSRSSSTPLYPQSATSQGACPQLLTLPMFCLIFTFESINELGGASSKLVLKMTWVKWNQIGKKYLLSREIVIMAITTTQRFKYICPLFSWFHY